MPFKQFIVVQVSGVGDRFEEVLVTRWATYGLGQAAGIGFDQPWVELAWQGPSVSSAVS